MSFPKYEAYKDSGTEWLGDIPKHWESWKLAHAFAIIGSGTTPNTSNPDYYSEGQIPWLNTGDLNDRELTSCAKSITNLAIADHSTLRMYESGSVVIAMYGATIGKLCILRFEATVNQACCVFSSSQIVQPEFLFYWFLGLRNRIISLATGGGQPNINQEVLRSLRVACPHLTEQSAIVAFLDRETDKIDALVQEQQRLIELLKEKRQSVISHAVTKGLNPDAHMKDSGVEWLGEVPEHWETLALKRACSLLKDGTHLPPPRVSEGVPLLSVRNIEGGHFALRDDDSFISEDNYRELCRTFVPQPGDVLLAIIGATLGKTALIPDNLGLFHIQRSLAIFRTKPASLLPRWLNFVFASSGFQNLLWEHVGYSAQPGIYLGSLEDFHVPVPSIDEQSEIISQLDMETGKLDKLIQEAVAAISLLQERRNALISAAVTGKIDVRGLVSVEAEAA